MDSNERDCDALFASNHNESDRSILADKESPLDDVEEPPQKRARKDNKKKPRRCYDQAYEGWTYTSVQFTWASSKEDPSNPASIQYSPRGIQNEMMTPPPGTPLRYFQASYHAMPSTESTALATTTLQAEMMVHQHRNGLCVVTVANGAQLWPHIQAADTFSWHYGVTVAPAHLSMAQKRQRHSKLLQSSSATEALTGDGTDGLVTPTKPLATLQINDNVNKRGILHIHFPCAVLGSVLECNRAYEQATTLEALQRLLVTDAHGTGYLAVVLPAGPFSPPPGRSGLLEKHRNERETVSTHEDKKDERDAIVSEGND